MIGKLTNEQLAQVILSGLTAQRDDVVLRPGIGVDCGAIQSHGRVVVFSSDPITAASADAGRLAVHVSLNDVAAAGAEPVGLLLVVLAPPGTETSALGELVRQAQQAAATLSVDILGGHTEFTDAVTRTVLCTTAIGLAPKGGQVFSSAGARPGDALVLTKWAGMEGTAIVASDAPALAEKVLSSEEIAFARGLADRLSVVPEGRMAAGIGVTAMHDVTEGGVLGAAWEMAQASGCGVRVNADAVPVLEVTRKLCALGGVEPLRLISSGCMLMAAADGGLAVNALHAAGIPAAIIGAFTEAHCEVLRGGTPGPMDPPGPDELFKLLQGTGKGN